MPDPQLVRDAIEALEAAQDAVAAAFPDDFTPQSWVVLAKGWVVDNA